ncbi:homoserine O-acetyltransferase family protein [Salirhabdus salicampi]|uniref:homoserine O-acetyltransferase family protein n=1 Tax=Salirhabdus salicampi TaxID=476102 RepID=UPI0020C4BD9B|nr:homoserine O-acetyltransferase [Salirhabdus salicampi]MCP8615927.1 homoserine O-acetyltransferase [Salirhabdus salicampi]
MSDLYESSQLSIGEFMLENGEARNCTIAYERVGKWPASHDQIIVICHALTGNQWAYGEHHDGWWSDFIGPGKMIDTNKYTVFTTNVIGGCNGTDVEQDTLGYPNITVRDMVRAQKQFLAKLDIDQVYAIVGGSLGGMQVWEWAVMDPTFAEVYVPLASTPIFSDYALAYNHIAEQAILSHQNETDSNGKGLEIARMIGMITYRSPQLFNNRFERSQGEDDRYEVQNYLDYQGNKLLQRFDENSYVTLLRAMNSHDITRGRGSLGDVLARIQAPILTVSFSHDLLYPPKAIHEAARQLENAGIDVRYHSVETDFGHDGFLVEPEKWQHVVKDFLLAQEERNQVDQSRVIGAWNGP